MAWCLFTLGLVTACEPVPIEARAATEPLHPLNASLVVRFGEARLLPASVTSASVRVLAEGVDLRRQVTVSAGALAIHLVVDDALLSSAPATVDVVLAGRPSLHALRFARGRRLERTQQLRFRLSGELAGQGATFRLLTIAGVLADGGLVAVEDPMELVFEGAIDPSSVVPESCPLARQEGALTLQPVLPDLAWWVVGNRSTLVLSGLPRGEALQLRLRDWALRDVAGRAPSPLLNITLDG